MAYKVFDLAQQLTTGTGSGALTLGAVPAGCIGFADQGAVAGDTFWGCIRHLTANEVEVTLCTIVGDGTITRAATPLISTTGSKISFSAGTKTISCVAPASKAVVMDNNGDAVVTRDFTAGRNITVAGDVTIAGSLTKANNVESAGGAQSFTFYDAGGGVRSGVGTSPGRFDLRSVDAFGFYSGASANIIALLASGGLTLSTTAGESLVLQSAGGHAYLRNQSGGDFYLGAVGLNLWRITAAGGHFLPESDNALNLGSASKRLGVLYAGTGTINTSGADSKMFISEADDAEKRAAARIKHLPRKYKFADAVERKGDAARWHFGYVAEDVRDALAAEGLDPWAYGFMCRDRVFANERYTETESRPKMRRVKDYENVVEVRDGKPVRIRKAVERDEPVGAMHPVYDEGGEPVMVEMRNAQGDVALAPMLHFVPEMEEVEVERVRQVDTGVDRLGLRYSELEAFLRCAA